MILHPVEEVSGRKSCLKTACLSLEVCLFGDLNGSKSLDGQLEASQTRYLDREEVYFSITEFQQSRLKSDEF